jgi:Raf kinase inhibitor-like YbhB/YbcL family protein
MIQRLIGRLLRGVNAGEARLALHHANAAGAPALLLLRSASFSEGGSMPTKHAGPGVGGNVSPALHWCHVPQDTRELLLVVEDSDAPLPRPFVHCIAGGIDPSTEGLHEGALSGNLPKGMWLGLNTFGRQAYAGPRALPGHGPDSYSFQLFALARPLDFVRPPKLKAVLDALDGRVLARGRLNGTFERL